MNHFLDPDLDNLRQLAQIIASGWEIFDPRGAADLLRSLHDELVTCRQAQK